MCSCRLSSRRSVVTYSALRSMYPVICSWSIIAASLSAVLEICASNCIGGSVPSSETTASRIAADTSSGAVMKNSRSTSCGGFSVASSNSFCAGVATAPPCSWIFCIRDDSRSRSSARISPPPGVMSGTSSAGSAPSATMRAQRPHGWFRQARSGCGEGPMR